MVSICCTSVIVLGIPCKSTNDICNGGEYTLCQFLIPVIVESMPGTVISRYL